MATMASPPSASLSPIYPAPPVDKKDSIVSVESLDELEKIGNTSELKSIIIDCTNIDLAILIPALNNHFANLENLTFYNADFSKDDLEKLNLSNLKTLYLGFRNLTTSKFQRFIEKCLSLRKVEISTFDCMCDRNENSRDAFARVPFAGKLNFFKIKQLDVIAETSTTLNDTSDLQVTCDEAVDFLNADWEKDSCDQVLKLRIFSKVDLFETFQKLAQLAEERKKTWPASYIPPNYVPPFKYLTLKSKYCALEVLKKMGVFFKVQEEGERKPYRGVREVKFIGPLKEEDKIRKVLEEFGISNIRVL
ncbi:MAG: hypothetical protein K1000chlam1_01604 [Candidatus Anoxychlamydiales bacterium]|nr:hypothetical protein [Candidatus Anoxychlamydiales bacterium]